VADIVLCNCLGSQEVDADAIAAATGRTCSRVHSALCGAEMDAAAQALKDGPAILACGQEGQRLAELAEELGVPAPAFVDIRDRAGWGGGPAGPKQAALLAEALLDPPEAKVIDVTSAGACLVIGRAAVAVPAAERLADALAVTVLLTDEADPPLDRRIEAVRGRLRAVAGSLGRFALTLDALRQTRPGGRGALGWGDPQDGARTGCDIVLDLSGEAPLFPAPHKRDGYLRADPGDPNGVWAAVLAARDLVGTFEKPSYVALDPLLCAHSRSGQTGCTRCLDLCPTGAIAPAGEHVAVDPMVCAGCGACHAVCPSGAISYDAPPLGALLARVRTLAEAYAAAGGAAPRLLVHDAHGAEMIALCARFARGLPAEVIPLAVENLNVWGHAESLAALTSGFAGVDVLPGPRTERAPLVAQIALAEAMGAAGRLRLIEVADPEALTDALAAELPPPAAPVLAMGARRQIARVAAQALMPGGDAPVPLPEGAPYGAVLVDTEACTLCLACVSLCPSGALIDNPDAPELRFQEDACLQCGLCARGCPEAAITLEPRFDPTPAALSPRILNAEEPFDCVSCGTPFGVRSTIERITAKLAGHSMFADEGALRLVQMCDDCRVKAQFHGDRAPMAAGERPAVRTTADYLNGKGKH
jgi:ferredoxin